MLVEKAVMTQHLADGDRVMTCDQPLLAMVLSYIQAHTATTQKAASLFTGGRLCMSVSNQVS
jgi:hypothetical protein